MAGKHNRSANVQIMAWTLALCLERQPVSWRRNANNAKASIGVERNMIPLVQEHRKALVALCRTHGVRTLDLFGSAATGAFDEATSDLDFVIEFDDYGPGIARRFFDFTDAVELLFGRPADFVFASEMRNPYFRAEVNATREPIYDAARNREAAA